MGRRVALLLLEGQHEEKFINDWKTKKYGVTESFDVKKVIHANQVNNVVTAYMDAYDIIYFIVDADDKVTNAKIEQAREMTENVAGLAFETFVQNPEMETFCASCFPSFTINDDDNDDEIKSKSRTFLKRKDPSVRQKEWTYTDILRNGGDIKNAQRYPGRFEIIKFLDK